MKLMKKKWEMDSNDQHDHGHGHIYDHRDRDPRFQVQGRILGVPTPKFGGGGGQPIIQPNFLQVCMKTRKIGLWPAVINFTM